MPSHVDSGSKSDKAAAAQGRKFMGRIYNTVEQKQAAQRAKASFSKSPSKGGKGGGSKPSGVAPAGGWGPSEVVEALVEIPTEEVVDRTVRLRLFNGSYGDVNVPGLTDVGELEILGIRVQVTYPPGLGYARFALAMVTNDAAVGKPIKDVAGVPGAVVSTDDACLAKYFTVPLRGVPVRRVATLNDEPTTFLYMRFQCPQDDDGPASFKFLFTVRKAKVGSASHAL